MKKYITLLVLVVSTAIVAQGNKSVVNIEGKPIEQNQNKYSGYQYVLSDDKFYEFKYTRNYSTDNNNFITKYLIYHPTTGRVVLTVKATHFPDEKKVVVDVEDPNGSIFSHINSEEIEYDTPSMAEFGFRGSVGGLGGNRIPNQLMVKFVSNKFENVKVVHVNATATAEPGMRTDFMFLILDAKN